MIVSETYYEGLRDVLRSSLRRTTKVSETCYEGLRYVLRRSQRRATKASETYYEGLRDVLWDVFSWYLLYVLETSPDDAFLYFLAGPTEDQTRTSQWDVLDTSLGRPRVHWVMCLLLEHYYTVTWRWMKPYIHLLLFWCFWWI